MIDRLTMCGAYGHDCVDKVTTRALAERTTRRRRPWGTTPTGYRGWAAHSATVTAGLGQVACFLVNTRRGTPDAWVIAAAEPRWNVPADRGDAKAAKILGSTRRV
jgi:hypothetical protein